MIEIDFLTIKHLGKTLSFQCTFNGEKRLIEVKTDETSWTAERLQDIASENLITEE